MKTVAMILELAAPLQAGFHIRVENEPWMTLVIAIPLRHAVWIAEKYGGITVKAA